MSLFNSHRRFRWINWLMLLCACASGCQSFRLPAIDPTGERIFLPAPLYTTVGPGPTGPAWQSPPQPPLCGEPGAGTVGVPYSIYAPPPPAAAPTNVPANPGAAPVIGTTPLPGVGATELSGQTSFEPTDGFPGRFTINPTRLVAPVGQEVILRAGICGADGYLMTGEPIEWSLSPDSVGTIVEVDQNNKALWRQLLGRPPYKRSGDFAVGLTSPAAQVIPRGTPDAADDIWLARGQTWISVSSAAEGATHVTGLAKRVAGWEDRRASATIHWIDGQWNFPAPSIGNVSSGTTLCTQVARATSGAPLAGWRVQYQIVGGAPATFAGGEQATEVASDLSGRACVNVIPNSGQPGVTHVQMRVIRSGQGTGDVNNIVVGEGATTITWSLDGPASPQYIPPTLPNPGLPTDPGTIPPATPPTGPPTPPTPTAPQLSLRVTGPETVRADEEVTYTFEIRNDDASTAENVELVNTIPRELRYVDSSPQANQFGDRLEWRVGSIPPGQSQQVAVRYVVQGGTTVRNCGAVRWTGASPIEGCAQSQIELNALMIDIRGDLSARIGEQARFDYVVTNLSDRRLENVMLQVDYDDGLTHPDGPTPLERKQGFSLNPGQTESFSLTFDVRGQGRLCQTASVRAEDGSRAQTSACLDAGGGPPSGTGGPLGGRPAFQVQLTGPPELQIGQREIFEIRITNTTQVPLTDLQINYDYDDRLIPRDATNGVDREGNVVFWRIPLLPAGNTALFQLRCEAVGAGPRVCSTATVQSAQGITESDRICVEIFEAGGSAPATDLRGTERPEGWLPGSTGSLESNRQTVARPSIPESSTNQDTGIRVAITPMGAGGFDQDKLTYHLEVTNTRDTAEENVVLTIETPEGTTFATSLNPPMIRASRASTDKRTVEFLPIATLRPNETAKFRVVVKRAQAQIGRFRAKVTSDRLTEGAVFSDKAL